MKSTRKGLLLELVEKEYGWFEADVQALIAATPEWVEFGPCHLIQRYDLPSELTFPEFIERFRGIGPSTVAGLEDWEMLIQAWIMQVREARESLDKFLAVEEAADLIDDLLVRP